MLVFGRFCAQTIHLSQVDLSPLNLNAALTGNAEGSFRIANTYRSQWAALSKPYVTNALSFDKRVSFDQNFVSAGLLINYDRTGDLALRRTEISLPVSYSVKLSNQSNLALGIQPVLFMHNLDNAGYTFPNQWEISSGSFNENLPSLETISANQVNRLTLNSGLVFVYKNTQQKLVLGAQLVNLLRPELQFLTISSNAVSHLRLSPHASFLHEFASKLFVQSLVQYHYMNRASMLNGGVNFGKKLDHESFRQLYGGVFMRSGFARNFDALILRAGLGVQNFDLGIAYDLNLSSLRQATGMRGAFELSLIYTNFYKIERKTTPTCERM